MLRLERKHLDTASLNPFQQFEAKRRIEKQRSAYDEAVEHLRGRGIDVEVRIGLAPDALREAVLWAQAEWERVIEHAAGAEEATTHLAQLCLAVRYQVCQQDAAAVVPRNPLSRRLLALVRDFLLAA